MRYFRQARLWRAGAAACVALLAVCLLGLAGAFLYSLRQAQFYFDRAALSHEQVVIVAQIETELARTGRAPPELLSAYLRTLAIEQALLAADPQGGKFDPRELEDATKLAAIGDARPTDLAREALLVRAHHLAAAINAREQSEQRESAADMIALRERVSMLGGGMVVLAALTAAAGAWLLMLSNARLRRLVASRTALLKGRNARLTAIDRSRRLFFAKVSHDLRTPVTVMRGEAEVTLADPCADDAQMRDALTHVVASADFLERRLADLLAIARAEDGRLALTFTEFNLADVLRDVSHEAERFARSSAVRIELETPPEPVMVQGDRLWLSRAVMSMADNGVKFSPTGGTLRLRLARAEDSAVIEVADSGAGAPPAELTRLFDPFYQSDDGRARGGSGLGLSLTRWLAEQHGGDVRASNAPGGGCVFAMRLPVRA
jgi:signal transduction histidine kinase